MLNREIIVLMFWMGVILTVIGVALIFTVFADEQTLNEQIMICVTVPNGTIFCD